MTFHNKTTKRLCVAMLCGAGVTTALLTSQVYYTVGQTPTPAAPNLEAPAATTADATIPPTVSATPIPGAANMNASIPGAANNANTAQMAQLRQRAAELQAELQRMPTSPQEQQAQQAIVAELLSVNAQIRNLESGLGSYDAFRQARQNQALAAAQAYVPPATAGDPTTSNALDVQGTGAFNASTLAPNGVPGANPLVTSGVAPVAGAPIDPTATALLTQERERLMQRYRQIQQMQRALQPNDVTLAENLRQEQTTILTQIRDLDARIAAVSPTPALPTQQPTPSLSEGLDPNAIPLANSLDFANQTQLPADNVAIRMEKANRAAALLREAGLTILADYASSEALRLSDPNFTETKLVPGSWANSDGMPEAQHNPFQQPSAKELETINNSIADMQKRLDSFADALANIDAQLRLLTRQQVSGYLPNTDAQQEANDVNPVEEQTGGEKEIDESKLPEIKEITPEDMGADYFDRIM